MINSFRISYSRNPDLFIRRLLNLRKGKQNEINYEDPHHHILKHRYMDEQLFVSSIQRMSPDVTVGVATELFSQLMERKSFGHQMRPVVDLCLFVSLFRSEDVGRRSFDFSDTLVAHDVEFWNQRRAPIPNGNTNEPTRPASASAGGRLSSAGVLRGSTFLETTRNPSINRHLRPGVPNESLAAGLEAGAGTGDQLQVPTQQRRQSSASSSSSCTDDNVSELLGVTLPQHPSGHNQGRYIVGVIRMEGKNDQTKVSAALHSPSREPTLMQGKRRIAAGSASPNNNISPQQTTRFFRGGSAPRRNHNIIHWLDTQNKKIEE